MENNIANRHSYRKVWVRCIQHHNKHTTVSLISIGPTAYKRWYWDVVSHCDNEEITMYVFNNWHHFEVTRRQFSDQKFCHKENILCIGQELFQKNSKTVLCQVRSRKQMTSGKKEFVTTKDWARKGLAKVLEKNIS